MCKATHDTSREKSTRNLHLNLHLHTPTTKTPTTTLQPVKNTRIKKATDQNYSKMSSSNQETEPIHQTLQDCPPLASVTNVAPSSDVEHCTPAIDKTTTIKTMKLRLPHPKALTFSPPPPTNGANYPSNHRLNVWILRIPHTLQTFLLPRQPSSPHEGICPPAPPPPPSVMAATHTEALSLMK